MHGGNVWQGAGPEAWLDYSANIRPGGAPKWVMEALEKGMAHAAYYPDLQMEKTREALGEYLRLPPSWVLPTAGGISAIDLAARVEGKSMALLSPCFGEYARACHRLGKEVISAPLLVEKHRLGDPAAQVEGLLSPGCGVWLCNPLNPVGAAFSRAQVEALLKRVEEMKGWLLVDEAFIAYCPQRSVVDFIRSHERLLVMGSMTKILGIPGVRLGYLCGQPQALSELANKQLPWEVSCFGAAVAQALPFHRQEIQREAAENALCRGMLRQKLKELGLFVYPSEASFLLVDFQRPVEPILQFLRARGILARSCLDFEGIDDGCHLRLAVKDALSNQRLAAVLEEAIVCAEKA